MVNTSETDTINKQMIVLWIIWAAMLLSLCIYILICHLIKDQISQNIDPSFPLTRIKNLLYIVVVIEIFIAYFLRKIILMSNASNPPGRSNTFPPAPSAWVGKYTIAMIIALAISESIGIYGLVLFFLGDSFQTLYTFMCIAALSMFYYRPKKDEIITLANNMQKKFAQSTGP